MAPARLLLSLVLPLLLSASLHAQRAFEMNGHVFYEDAAMQRIDLGAGFNPLLTADGNVALIRGRRFEYGDRFDCGHKESKNWVVVYDPLAKREKTIFDRTLSFERQIDFCIFAQMQLSHDGSTLYLVSLTDATSGSLAIVDLKRGSVEYVPGVNLIYVIEAGPRRDELIYQRRMFRGGFPGYPFVHARADGSRIAEISNEWYQVGGDDRLPVLRAYLRKIGATIIMDGRKVP